VGQLSTATEASVILRIKDDISAATRGGGGLASIFLLPRLFSEGLLGPLRALPNIGFDGHDVSNDYMIM
jgi:hypothetical protein